MTWLAIIAVPLAILWSTLRLKPRRVWTEEKLQRAYALGLFR
jgi:hypothetical protein